MTRAQQVPPQAAQRERGGADSFPGRRCTCRERSGGGQVVGEHGDAADADGACQVNLPNLECQFGSAARFGS